MQAIKQIQALNKRELENAVPPSASWHADHRDTAYIYIGGLDSSLSEGDIITIFSEFGEPTHINLIRDKESGKSKGYGFLKYEDQRSTDLAVDNLGGAVVVKGGMQLRVEHARYEKRKREGEEEEEMDNVRWDKVLRVQDKANGNGRAASDTDDGIEKRRLRKKSRPLLKEERELEELMRNEDDEEDPMKQYLIEEKKAEVERALAKIDDGGKRKHKHRHRERDTEGRSHKHRERKEEDEQPRSQQQNRRHSPRRREDLALRDRHRRDRSREVRSRSRDRTQVSEERKRRREQRSQSTSPRRHRRRHGDDRSRSRSRD
ncbi:MAG: hypothetical protein Q9227_003023 [Pyrenula ochraceoflavens]